VSRVAVRPDPDVAVRPITVAELDRMVEAGIIGEDDRVELLDGMLVAISPQSPDHAAVLRELLALAWPVAAATQLTVSSQAPLDVGHELSRPEPDLALVPRPPVGRHPTGALLVVEIAATSRSMDLGRKATLYSAAGVPDYWVADLAARELVVHREPGPDGYRLVRRMTEGEEVTAERLPLRIDVSALFAYVSVDRPSENA